MYRAADEDVSVNAIVKDETIWLTQSAMAELFGVKVPAISKHLKNIFEEGELNEKVVISKMEITTQHGAIAGKTQTRDTQFYNLDATISVGYRVNSRRATQFRIWATSVLKEYIRKGFAMDDERLKQGTAVFGSKLQIFLRNAASTTTKTPRLRMTSMQWFKINFTMPLWGRLRRKSSIPRQIKQKKTWALPPGKTLLTGAS